MCCITRKSCLASRAECVSNDHFGRWCLCVYLCGMRTRLCSERTYSCSHFNHHRHSLLCSNIQVHLVNKALESGDALVIVPAYFVLGLVFKVTSGIIFFQDYMFPTNDILTWHLLRWDALLMSWVCMFFLQTECRLPPPIFNRRR